MRRTAQQEELVFVDPQGSARAKYWVAMLLGSHLEAIGLKKERRATGVLAAFNVMVFEPVTSVGHVSTTAGSIVGDVPVGAPPVLVRRPGC